MSAVLESSSEAPLPPSSLFTTDIECDADPNDPRLDGQRNVWCRVLVMSICDYWLAPPSSVRFKEALAWIFNGDPAAANSFHNVCLFLRLEPTRARAMVARRCSEFREDPSRAASVVRAMQAGGFSPGAGVSDEEGQD